MQQLDGCVRDSEARKSTEKTFQGVEVKFKLSTNKKVFSGRKPTCTLVYWLLVFSGYGNLNFARYFQEKSFNKKTHLDSLLALQLWKNPTSHRNFLFQVVDTLHAFSKQIFVQRKPRLRQQVPVKKERSFENLPRLKLQKTVEKVSFENKPWRESETDMAMMDQQSLRLLHSHCINLMQSTWHWTHLFNRNTKSNYSYLCD